MTITNLDFLNKGQPWPPLEEAERFKRYEENRLLFENKHHLVYKEWIKVLREDQKATLEIILNWHKRISTLWADLLLGEPPKFTSTPENVVKDYVDDVFLNNCYMVVLDLSRFGDGLFTINYRDGKWLVEPTTPQVWIPIVGIDNVQAIKNHVLAWVIKQTNDRGSDSYFLRVIIHHKGYIENKLFMLIENYAGDYVSYVIGDEMPLNTIQDFEGIEPVIETGVNEFLVVPVHNLITSERATGFDDYEDIDGIVQELEIRFAQLSKILDEHAAPTLAGPDSLQQINPYTGEAVFDGLGKYIGIPPEDTKMPTYLTWDPNIAAIEFEINALLEQLYVISETSPAAFGQLKAGLAESGSALKRLMLAPLAKVNRIRLRLDPAIKKAIKIAAELNGQKLSDVKIEWHDGLPDDVVERAQIDTQEVNVVASLDTILKRRGFEGEALEKEKQLINDSKPQEPEIEMPVLGGSEEGDGNGGVAGGDEE